MSSTNSPTNSPTNPLTSLTNLQIPPDLFPNLVNALNQMVAPQTIASLEALLFIQMIFMSLITISILIFTGFYVKGVIGHGFGKSFGRSFGKKR